MPNGQYLFHARCISSVLAAVLRLKIRVCAWVHSVPPLGEAATFNYHLGHVQHAWFITAEYNVSYAIRRTKAKYNSVSDGEETDIFGKTIIP